MYYHSSTAFLCVCMSVCIIQSSLSLCSSWIVACQTPLSMEFSRQEYWSGLPIPSPGNLPNAGMGHGPYTEGRFFTIWTTRKALPFTSASTKKKSLSWSLYFIIVLVLFTVFFHRLSDCLLYRCIFSVTWNLFHFSWAHQFSALIKTIVSLYLYLFYSFVLFFFSWSFWMFYLACVCCPYHIIKFSQTLNLELSFDLAYEGSFFSYSPSSYNILPYC